MATTTSSSSSAPLPLLLLLLLSLAAGGAALKVEFSLRASCPRIAYNYLYRSYGIELPLAIHAAGTARFADVAATADAALAARGSGIRVVAHADDETSGVVTLLCDRFRKCSQLRDQIGANPQVLTRAVTFSVVSGHRRRSVSVGVHAALSSHSLLKPNCNRGWVVFQQRVDGGLSFRQNYATYERGFGRVGGNYWMGLKNLHNLLRAGTNYNPCRLRIHTESATGHKYRGEWKHFYVMGAASGYQIRVSGRVAGTQFKNSHVTYMNGARFTTYDRDQDSYKGQCSRRYGYGGWWYKSCHYLNLNGEYPTKNTGNSAAFAVAHLGTKYVPMTKTKMEFRCDVKTPSSSSHN